MYKRIDESKVKQDLSERLRKGFTDRLFTVRTDERLYALFAKIVYADIVVYDVDGSPVAVFEVKGFPQAWALRKQLDFSLSLKNI